MLSTKPTPTVSELKEKANLLRRDILKMIAAAGSGHPGGSLSAIDAITCLYFGGVMRYDPENPDWPDRDRFILSKGHAAPALYAALAEAGYFPKEELSTLRRIDSPLQGHPSVKDLKAVEASTGSLGQGLSIGLGMALAARLDERPSRVYVLIGDGEAQEGQIWEAAQAAGFYGVDNLVCIVDHNRFQLDGPVDEILERGDLEQRWRSFGWHVVHIDGHEMRQLLDAFSNADQTKGKPTLILAETVKGKGVSFMENDNEFHGRAPTEDELKRALAELA